MHADDAVRRRDRGTHLPRVHPGGRAFQEHTHRLAENTACAGDDEYADQDCCDRVGVGPIGRDHHDPRHDDSSRRREIRQNVQHRGTDVQAGAGAVEDARRDEIHDQPGETCCKHPAARDAGRV